MGQNRVKSCKACSADSEDQYGGINHGRIFCLESSHEGTTEQLPQQKPPALWSEEQVQEIQRQMGILSMHCKAPAVGWTKVPTDNKVDASRENSSSDQTKDDNGQAMSRGIELNCQPGLPYGWEQFLDIETGEIYYIDWSCGKRASTDPRLIMLDIEEKINAQINSIYDKCFVSDNAADSLNCCFQSALLEDDAKSSSCISNDVNFEGHANMDFESSDSVKDDGHLVLSLKGCKKCLIYFLIPGEIMECPSCKTCFLEVDKLSGSCG